MTDQQPPAGAGQQSSQQTAKAVTDLTSNLLTALKNAGVLNAQAFQILANTLPGVIAAITAASAGAAAGAVAGGVGAAVGFVAGLISVLVSQGPDEIQQVGQQLEALIQQFEQAEAASQMNVRYTSIQNSVSKAQSVAQQINSLQATPPTSAEDIRNTLQPATEGLDDLNPPADPSQPAGLWAWPLGYTVPWDDSDSPDITIPSELLSFGYGKQAPPADPSGTNVFNYTHVLPSYLYCLTVAVSVGALIDPNFKQDYIDAVLVPTGGAVGAVALLQNVHDYIVSQGLKQLVPPQPVTAQNLSGWYELMLPGMAKNFVNGIKPGITRAHSGGTPPPGPSGGLSPGGGVTIEYGAVETLSGYSSVGLYTILVPYNSNINYSGKFQIRLLRRYKDVYVGTGLLALWGYINNLLQLSGKAPVAAPNGTLADWSFRRDIVGNGKAASRLDGSTSLQDVMSFFLNTPPGDVPQSLWPSFRNVLNV